ncbi:MAG: RNA polymerase sigma factor [Patescibacteria group bacterium]
MDEKDIIKKCQRGDMGQFARLYDRYADKIYRFIYYKTMHRETAEDLTSQAFMKAMEALPRFDSARGSFSSWLYRIARNGVIDHYRTAKNVEGIDGAYGLHDGREIPVDLDAKRSLDAVRQYLATIQREHREIVVMKLWDQLSYREIAEITGKSAASCKVAFSRTMARLREDMAFALASLIVIIINSITI